MKIILCILSAAILVSCSMQAPRSYVDEESVYEVVSRSCVGSQQAINSCQSILLLELVKGNFYKISDKDMAFVVWSGEKNDLTYSARKLEGIGKVSTGEPIIIFESLGYLETLSIGESYDLVYRFGSGKSLSSIYLRKVEEGDLKGYVKQYPGSD